MILSIHRNKASGCIFIYDYILLFHTIMNRLKNILVLLGSLLCIYTSPVQAQETYNAPGITIQFGETLKLPKKHMKYSFIGDLDNGFTQISYKSHKEIGLFKLSPNLELQGTSISPVMKSKYFLLEDVINLGGRYYLVSTDYDKKNNSEKLYFQEVDARIGQTEGEPKLMIETDTKVAGYPVMTGFYKFATYGKFNIMGFGENPNFLVYYNKRRDTKRGEPVQRRYSYALFSKDLQQIWQKDVNVGQPDQQFRVIGQRLIGNDIYIFARSRSDDNPKAKGKPFDDFIVFYIADGSDEAVEYRQDLNDSRLSEFIISVEDAGSIMIAGYFTAEKTLGYKGYFTALFDVDTKEMTDFRKYDFSPELVRAFESARDKRKMDRKEEKRGEDRGMTNLETRQIIKRSGGGHYLVGEQYYMYVTSYTDSRGNTRYTYHYMYQDIIVSALDNSGQEEWTIKVPKNQHLTNTTYTASVQAFEYNDRLYLFYMDHPKNRDLDPSSAPVQYRGFKDGALVMTRIEPQGEYQTNFLFDTRSEEKLIVPTGIIELQPGKLISSGAKARLFGYKNNTPALITLE